MSIEKSELKAAFAHALGCDSDDDLEAARRDVFRATGRIQAARMLEGEITKIVAKLDMDMESDAPPFRTMEDLKRAKFYLGACLAKAATAAKASDNLRLQMEGKVMAFEHTLNRLSKIKEAEERKAQAIKTAQEADHDEPRTPGAHPGPSISMQRKAEASTGKKQTSKRKCGKCGEPGHTARTCKKKKNKKKS